MPVAPFSRAGIKRVNQRLLRQRRGAETLIRLTDAVVDTMRARGLTLNRTHHSAEWRLSNGAAITPAVARKVITDPSIIGTGDTLLDDWDFSQTFRHTEEKGEN